MTLHGSPLRTLLLLGLCAWFSVHRAASTAQGTGAAQAKTAAPIAHFTDIAQKAGLAAPVIFGGENTKKYIIETTGTGVAIFDYDNDGWPDIFIVNGTKLEGLLPAKLRQTISITTTTTAASPTSRPRRAWCIQAGARGCARATMTTMGSKIFT
jgi:hypothetical protein